CRATLAKMPALEGLLLRIALIGDELKSLCDLRHLRRLDLPNCELNWEPKTRPGPAIWASKIYTLEELYLEDCVINEGDLAALSGITRLRLLDLCGSTTSPTEIAHLCSLPRLERLGLSPWMIDEAMLEVLKRFPCLKTLSVSSGDSVLYFGEDREWEIGE